VFTQGADALQITDQLGVKYNFPGWSWQNNKMYPDSNPASGYFKVTSGYMDEDTDRAPWNDGDGPMNSGKTAPSGFYDRFLPYAVAARILREQNDDTTRADEFSRQADEIKTILIRDEFLWHNLWLSGFIPVTDVFYIYALYFKTLAHLGMPITGDSAFIDNMGNISGLIYNELNELYSAYTWPLTKNFVDWAPYQDIFTYGAAARLAPKYGLPEEQQRSLLATYETMKQALLREKLYNNSGVITSGTTPYLYVLLRQLRGILQDFTKDTPDLLLKQFLNEAYHSIVFEREWRFMEVEDLVILEPYETKFNTPFGTRIMSMYEVEFDFDGCSSTTYPRTVGQIYPAGHLLDTVENASRYTYSMAPYIQNNFYQSMSFVDISPSPTKDLWIAYRYALEPNTMTGDYDLPFIPAKFASIIVYRAAKLAMAFKPEAKQMLRAIEEMEQKLYDAMLRAYQLDTSTETFSIGENALETRKYLPFFRVG
jgi:hypothetical protein